jgi:hypothetical protein
MINRNNLPNRREIETFEFEHNGMIYVASVSYFIASNRRRRLAEVFLDAGKIGSQTQMIARDAAVQASIALQYSVPADELARSLCKIEDADGNFISAGPLGKVFEICNSKK